MATAIIKYDLNDPDDRMDFDRANASLKMASFIFEILLNGKKKFRDCDCADRIWEYLLDEAKDKGVNIENLIQ